MKMNVYDLAQADTSLKRVSHKEYAGQCPKCGGEDRFHLQPYRREGGAWMCRNCWPAEEKGWGDGIAYLRHFRGMSFIAARDYLEGEIDSLLETVYNAQDMHMQQALPDNEQLQERYENYIKLAIIRLWAPQGKPCLDYLLSRGLKEETIRAARLGSIDSATVKREYLGRVEVDTQFIVFPWYADKLLWAVNMRDIRPDVPPQERYRKFPKSGNGLYLADSLKLKRPTFMVEGEIDALSIAQEAGDLVSVVATGGKDGSQTSTWVTRLARVPDVLVAFDREPEGEEKSKVWLRILNHNAIRCKPKLKDANKMLVEGLNVRSWVVAYLDYLNDQSQDAQPVQAAATTQETPDPQTYEQFVGTVTEIANRLGEKMQQEWTVTLIPEGYTLEQHVARLRLARMRTEPTAVEQALMERLKGYHVYFSDSICSCGCYLKWNSAGTIVCARCCPGGLWSDISLRMLEQSCSLQLDQDQEGTHTF